MKRNEKILHQYTISTDGKFTRIYERGNKTPTVMVGADGAENPLIAASLLRDLARYAIEQAEEIEAREGLRPRPRRTPFGEYKAEIVECRKN